MLNISGLSIRIIEKNENSLVAELRFSDEYEYFDGHFNDFKLLPALIQIHLVTEFTRDYLDLDMIPTDIANLKFVKPIRPEEVVELSISVNASMAKVDFIFTRESEKYSFGSLKYEK